MIRNPLRLCIAFALIFPFATLASAQGRQSGQSTPSQDVEQITAEAQRTPQQPLLTIDRPLYQALQQNKKELNEKYGINWALEDTLIYQATSGGVTPNDAMVNTLGLFATWKIIRDPNGKDFGGLGFQFETRSNHIDEFTDLRDNLGTLWSPNDSTSGSYSRINQLWWGQRFADGRLGIQIGKIDPGANINGNRFAGSGNTQFFGQPFATNPARSFPDNGFGFMIRAEPTDLLYMHFTMSDSDAVNNHSPFTTIGSHWLYAGEVGLRPRLEGLGQGNYRLMLYERDASSASEFGWALSFDQNLSNDYGVFLRYDGNDGDINAIQHLLSGGLSFLAPFGRPNDQAGIAVSYTHPADHHLRDEYSAEAYYRVQLTEGIELSGSAQLIQNPAASDQDTVAVFGLRLRVLY
jgi:porin